MSCDLWCSGLPADTDQDTRFKIEIARSSEEVKRSRVERAEFVVMCVFFTISYAVSVIRS